ncbi:hypothetical protein LAWI1_G008506 [Lachnellula willkommii]|uniref:Reverse transcriptase domain-containing protein n=1 Tax=Lachnellula willkommii TaxID=215461 RepID=A0A559M3D7_9HELO|nr:hypothetical protein LAWI1_G008506 [Lachnellula willkommii]
MASAEILSRTLSSITGIKLEELSIQRSSFEDEKAKLLKAVSLETSQKEKLRVLLRNIEKLPTMGDINRNPLISVENIRRYLEQSQCDPSVSDEILRDWQSKLEKELDVHSLRYEYASLYGRLVTECLSVSDEAVMETLESSIGGSGSESIGRKEMHEQREKWEEYVFKPLETDTEVINKYMTSLVNKTKESQSAFAAFKKATTAFESDMAKTGWVIRGILRADLSDEKRKVLNDFKDSTPVLLEVADVLNMRMASLARWNWDSKGTPIIQRRMLSGRYRFYHDEDLLQSLLLQYIGTKWSVHMKAALDEFKNSPGVWKASSAPISKTEKMRRDWFLGPRDGITLEVHLGQYFDHEIFLEQLKVRLDDSRDGYDDDAPGQQTRHDTRRSPLQMVHDLLQVLSTETIIASRLNQEQVVVRSDFKWFGPSLPHSTIFAVLRVFNVSGHWINFFRRSLEVPTKFVVDGPDAPIQVRKRGTVLGTPLSDFFAESVLFCLDFAFNQETEGARLYRLHDDIWFWGSEERCVKGWNTILKVSGMMGLEMNEEKTGSVIITSKTETSSRFHSSLPKGDVRWGFLKLDAGSGRFLIDQVMVDKHIEELKRQLDACKSTFDWIQAWNIYGARFFTNNFGKPANCFGKAHVDMMLETCSRIQAKVFESSGGSVTAALKQMISDRFGVKDIPEGYLYFPASMGGLDLKSPFVPLYMIRDKITENPVSHMDRFFENEDADYRRAKSAYESGDRLGPRFAPPGFSLPSLLPTSSTSDKDEPFMSFEEFSRNREQTSTFLGQAYRELIREPRETNVTLTSDVSSIPKTGKTPSTPYEKWIIQLYGPEMLARFGSLNVIEPGLLPTGMVGMFRESRFKWQG